MRDGGVLGFASHHRYVYTDLNKTEDLPSLLKGADLLVYMVAKSLGLSVIVNPVVKGTGWYDEQVLLKRFHKIQHNDYFEECRKEQFEELFGPGHHVKHISWCQTLEDSQWQAAGFSGHYGNEPSLVAYYQTATILVGIPEWGEERKRSSAIGSIQETSEDEGLEPGEGERPTKRHCASISTQNSCDAVLEKLCFHGELPEDW